ncbi:MAG TPA: ABC transporter permease [Anaerolineae bacterium]|nr:ABC transporter permease [Anaerolineae bacterium]
MRDGWTQRIQDELAQVWAVAVKDVRVYYLTPPMIMFGLLLPFFLFFSFSIKREISAEVGIARLLALTTFFTASSAGPVIIPMERRARTYDRLLAAPMSLVTLLLGKTLVGAFFAVVVSVVPLAVGLFWLHVTVANAGLLVACAVLASLAFSAFGLVFGSIPTSSAAAVGSIMMPSTLVRWPLLFISGIFIPLGEMASWARALAYLSPLTYAQDLMNHAVLGTGYLNWGLDLTLLLILLAVFLLLAVRMHHRSRELGY